MSSEDGVPRQVWQSADECYRVVIVADCHVQHHNRAGASTLPVGQGWALEVIDGYDALGCKRWRVVDSSAEPGAWFNAFACLAAERGLFGGTDVTDQVRQLLRDGEQAS